MMPIRAACVLVALLASTAPKAAFACSCFTEEDFLEKDAAYLRRVYEAATSVVRIRVTAVLSRDAAEVAVVEAFKGGADVRTVVGDGTMCSAAPFAVGDEFLAYFRGDSREISYCNAPMARVLEVLRRWKH